MGEWCDVGGTLPPPITPNNANEPVHGFNGGHLTEPGLDLHGFTFARNVTIRSNAFVSPATDPYGKPWKNNFLNLGGVDGLVVTNNSFVRRAARDKDSAADLVVYSNTNAVLTANRCLDMFGAEVECVVRNETTCASSVNKC